MSATHRERSDTLQALSDNLAAAVDHAAAWVVAVNARPRIAASGLHWRPGVVVTADHTVRLEDDITVTLSDGRTVPATLAGRDAATDLAVLRIDGSGVPAADFAEPGSLKVGHVVLQVGRPGGGPHPARVRPPRGGSPAPPRRTGLIVLTVDADGPAGRGGLQLSDVIVAVDQQPVADVRDLLALLAPERVGSTVAVEVLRGGTPHAIRVTVAERPAR